MAMDVSVKAIDSGLADVTTTTEAMSLDMTAMAEASAASAETMTALDGDIGFLSRR